MSLPFDNTRCTGGTLPICEECLRRTSPAGPNSPTMKPPHEAKSCALFVAPRED